MKKEYSWLQISDLHIFESTDWNIMKIAYKKLAKKIKPDFLIITGDYRHKLKNNNYKIALNFLNEIIRLFNLDKHDVFLVPGNHDVNNFDVRNEIITTIKTKTDLNPDTYTQYMEHNNKDLRQAFDEYHSFVCDFYGDSVDDSRVKSPSDVLCFQWRENLNIIHLNTALISDGNRDSKEIVDIKTLSEIEPDYELPTIVIAHHHPDCLIESHRTRVENILNELNVSAYFCGDKHKIEKGILENKNIPNTTIPCFVCGKSAIEMGDNYSDLNVIEYTYKSDGNTYVQVYNYENGGFFESNKFYYDVNKRFNFPMKKNIEKTLSVTKDVKTKNHLPSIWLPDAELAKGKQTRFNSFTETDAISQFFDDQAGYLGIASVKGIGKTFVLQVKRVKSSKKYYCLPKTPKPSINNNWATECVSFNSYSSLKTDHIYDDLVLLWKTAIKCYIINHFSNENIKTIQEYIDNNKLSQELGDFCLDKNNGSLKAIMDNIVNMAKWNEEIFDNQVALTNLCRITLKRRKLKNKSAKSIAVFIDKVDQSIKQTNSEPPADCVVCKKRDNYSECKSHKKKPDFCTSETGCQSKNCCYGCEVFAGPKSNDGLRIYEESNAAKLIHVNIWQYLQLALMNAANQISEDFQGEINVFYTIRQEAYNCEENRLGEQNQKIAGRIINLSYTKDEQHQIFLDCIKEQEPCYLFDPSLQNKIGSEEYSFVGVNKLCHPYCKDEKNNNVCESVFDSIYRHSFDRSRDIQRFGVELTKKMNSIKNKNSEHEREEIVKQTIEDLAASLAYRDKQSESTVNPSYYTEKMRYLPNYWADNDNFEKLLSLIDKNLLFDEDIKRICRSFNNMSSCPTEGCSSKHCLRHPFSVLYNMGYLGYIIHNHNNSIDEIQKFLNASEVTYFTEKDVLLTVDRAAYIIHPALTKTIERKYNKSFMHFSGFLLGKDLPVKTKVLMQLFEDKSKLDYDSFIEKYYHKPKSFY